MNGTATLTAHRRMLVAPDEEPEGALIADMVDALIAEEETKQNSFFDERKPMPANHSKAKVEAFTEVLQEIEDRFGYVPARRERCQR